MLLSLIFAPCNTKNFLKQVLRAIEAFQFDFEYEIIVVDIGSNDGTVEMMRKDFPEIKLIAANHNIGHAVANNLGMRQARGKYIAILNADLVFLNNPFPKVLEFFEKNPKVGIWASKLLNADKSIQESTYGRYGLWTTMVRRTFFGKTGWGRKEIDRFTIKDWDRSTSRFVDWAISSCLFLRREMIEQVGMFDSRFKFYMSDTEYGLRAQRCGFPVWYEASFDGIVHYYRKESADKMGFFSVLNRATRVHIRDWLVYMWITWNW